MRSWAMLVESLGGVQSFGPIIETVRTGKPGLDIACGMGIFEFLSHHPEQAQGFQAAMSERTAERAIRGISATPTPAATSPCTV